MVTVGELRYGREIGQKDSKHKYRWSRCEDCGYERWVCDRGRDTRYLCHPCARKRQVGDKSPGWHGGVIRHKEGYIDIKIYPDDFFYPMANGNGYIYEHRLVMARFLKRCLLPWEIVHHRNGIRSDNKLENLELLPTKKYHIADTLTKSLVKTMRKRIKYLETKLIANDINF